MGSVKKYALRDSHDQTENNFKLPIHMILTTYGFDIPEAEDIFKIKRKNKTPSPGHK